MEDKDRSEYVGGGRGLILKMSTEDEEAKQTTDIPVYFYYAIRIAFC